jgi:hypothetical protein
VADVDLNTRITDVGNLIGLVLVLLPLFTSQRAAALRMLRRDPRRDEVLSEVVVIAALLLLTSLLVAAGGRLWWDTAWHLHPGAPSGAIRSIFLIALALLLGLFAWQLKLLASAFTLSRTLKSTRSDPAESGSP